FQRRVSLRASTAPRMVTRSVSTEFKSSISDDSKPTKYFAGFGSSGIPMSAFIFQRQQMIKDLLRQLIFAHERQCADGVVSIENRSNIGIDVEAGFGVVYVIGNNHVEVFLLKLFLGIGYQLFCLGGKSYQHLPVLPSADLLENVRIGFEAKFDRTVTPFHFLVNEANWAIIGNSCGHDHSRTLGKLLQNGIPHLGSRCHRYQTS